MIYTAYRLTDGQILYSGSTSGDEPIVESGQGWIEGEYSNSTHYVDFMAVPPVAALRPVTPVPVLTGNVLSFDGILPETRIEITDSDGEQTTRLVSDGPITFGDVGIYVLNVMPPFPWTKHYALQFTVTTATSGTFGRNRNRYRRYKIIRFRRACLIAQQGSVTSEAYRDKEAEADRWYAQPTPPTNLSTYPYIAAEVGYTGATGADVADVFRKQRNSRRRSWTALESLRAQHQAALEAATTIADIDRAFAAARDALVTWTTAEAPFSVDQVTATLEGTQQ